MTKAKTHGAKVKFKVWREFVKHLVRKNPGVPLKRLLQTYDKKEYEKFKHNPKKMLWIFFVF